RRDRRRHRAARRARLPGIRVAGAVHPGPGDFSSQLALRLGGRQRSAPVESRGAGGGDAAAGFSRPQKRRGARRLAACDQPLLAPARAALYHDPEILRRNPQFESQYQTFIRAVPRPRTPVYLPLANIMQRYFSSAIALKDSDIDALARSAARDMDRVLELLRDRSAP